MKEEKIIFKKHTYEDGIKSVVKFYVQTDCTSNFFYAEATNCELDENNKYNGCCGFWFPIEKEEFSEIIAEYTETPTAEEIAELEQVEKIEGNC